MEVAASYALHMDKCDNYLEVVRHLTGIVAHVWGVHIHIVALCNAVSVVLASFAFLSLALELSATPTVFDTVRGITIKK